MSRVAGISQSVRPYAMAHAINETRRKWGHDVDPDSSAQSLLKFGRNTDVDTGAQETVWQVGGHETYLTTNAIDTISSSSASDTETLFVEGHSISGSGTNTRFTTVIQEVTLTGQTKATLSTPLARVQRMYNTGTTDLAGDVYLYEDTAIVTGVPSDLTKAHIMITGSVGDNQTFKAASTSCDGTYTFITQVHASVTLKTNAICDLQFQVREPGGVFRPKFEFSISQGGGGGVLTLDPYIIVPQNSDIRMAVVTSANDTQVNAGYSAYIAHVLNS